MVKFFGARNAVMRVVCPNRLTEWYDFKKWADGLIMIFNVIGNLSAKYRQSKNLRGADNLIRIFISSKNAFFA